MMNIDYFRKKLFQLNEADFDELALQLLRYQYHNNNIYKAYVDALKVNIDEIKRLEDIPFLPIGFFKTHKVVCGNFQDATVFESSGTTGSVNSRHYIKDLALYEESFERTFNLFYGQPKDYVIIGLLPSYLERQNSSLVYMVEKLMKLSSRPENDFFLNDFEKLNRLLQQLEHRQQPTLLIGVTFALLDFAVEYPQKLRHTRIMETGGMKGRKKEMTRAEVHDFLKTHFELNNIHSEYGMTELMSQAYAQNDGLFKCPPWMKVLIRDENDPLTTLSPAKNQSGPVNIIDLANIHSCAFLATEDVGKLSTKDKFEIMGRRDNTDLRGCSLMATQQSDLNR